MSANAGHITSGTPEQLSRLQTLVEKVIDQNTSMSEKIEGRLAAVEARKVDGGPTAEQYTEVRDALASQGETLTLVQERLKNLDAVLPTGNKVYTPIVETETSRQSAMRDEIARTMLDIAITSRGQRPKFDSEYFKRDQTEGVDADGGRLMPVEYRAEIIRIVQNSKPGNRYRIA